MQWNLNQLLLTHHAIVINRCTILKIYCRTTSNIAILHRHQLSTLTIAQDLRRYLNWICFINIKNTTVTLPIINIINAKSIIAPLITSSLTTRCYPLIILTTVACRFLYFILWILIAILRNGIVYSKICNKSALKFIYTSDSCLF